jgi:hypothetical protein
MTHGTAIHCHELSYLKVCDVSRHHHRPLCSRISGGLHFTSFFGTEQFWETGFNHLVPSKSCVLCMYMSLVRPTTTTESTPRVCMVSSLPPGRCFLVPLTLPTE